MPDTTPIATDIVDNIDDPKRAVSTHTGEVDIPLLMQIIETLPPDQRAKWDGDFYGEMGRLVASVAEDYRARAAA